VKEGGRLARLTSEARPHEFKFAILFAMRRTTPPRDQMYAMIYDAVRAVPRGRVVTYGQIASMLGFPRHARMVGRALRALGDESVPWHRVVNAGGDISPRTRGDSHELQRLLLEAEGVEFNRQGRIDLERVRWDEDHRERPSS
jgi:methylated-DNA-protein-cysteine methyltransferase related protein